MKNTNIPEEEALKHIPEGPRCYKIENVQPDPERGVIVKTKFCPYHYYNPEKPSQSDGGCRYLGVEDDDIGVGLLWDGVKECGLNIPEIEEDED